MRMVMLNAEKLVAFLHGSKPGDTPWGGKLLTCRPRVWKLERRDGKLLSGDARESVTGVSGDTGNRAKEGN